MSKKEQTRRRSPLQEGPGSADIDPSVQKVRQAALSKSLTSPTSFYKVRLPTELAASIKAEAARLTGHKQRGWSDMVTVLVTYGWEAWLTGELRFKTQAVSTALAIVRDDEPA